VENFDSIEVRREQVAEKIVRTPTLAAFSYQEPLIAEVLANITKRPVVLAACPNAGKTEMVILILKAMLKKNPKLKILILAHGTVGLRANFVKRIEMIDVLSTLADALQKAVVCRTQGFTDGGVLTCSPNF